MKLFLSGHDKNKRKDVYVVNDSAGSKKSTKSAAPSSKSENYDPIPKAKVKQMQLIRQRPNSNTSEEDNLAAAARGEEKSSTRPMKSGRNRTNDSWSNSDFEKMFEAVDADEIKRQKNSRALRKHLKEIAHDWDNEVNDLNTLRRNKVLKELHNYLKNTIDLARVRPEEIGIQVEVALRQALDAHFETMSNLNLGQMYVPMEDNPSNSKAVSRENTDYDTFGSIDSLIFEPKIPTHEDIKEAQEEIEHQFEYLDHIGVDESVYDDITLDRKPEDIVGPGKTTFAERVKLFQKLGKKEQETESKRNSTPIQRPVKKITTLEVCGQETTWKEVAKAKGAKKLGSEALRVIESAFGPRTSRLERQEESCSDGDEYSSVCPDCQNRTHNGEESLGTLACSSCAGCDCCTQCDAAEDEDRRQRVEDPPYHVSIATGSWDFEKPALPAKMEKMRFENNAVVAKCRLSEGPAPVVGNLRQKLKEAFGANLPIHLVDLAVKLSSDEQSCYGPLTYGSSSVERDVDHQEDFLIEYGKKQNLIPIMNFDDLDEDGQSIGGSSAIVFRGGKATQLTEEMFRGELIQSSKDKTGPKLVVASSEMGDSGIVSPFRTDGSLQNQVVQAPGAAASVEEGSRGSVGDSGVGEPEKIVATMTMAQPPEPPPLPAPPSISSGTLFLVTPRPSNQSAPPFKKRDTMIRELKSKLKEKFSLDSSSTSSSENNSLVKINSQRPVFGGEGQGNVPKLSKVFESRRIQVITRTDGDKSSSAETSITDPSLQIEIHRPSEPAKPSSPLPIQPKPDVPKRESPLSIVRESPSNSSASASTVKENISRKSPPKIVPDDMPQRELAASPHDARELLYGPGGLFGPKGPFSTPNVRYPHGLDVGLASNPKRNVHFEHHANSRPQLASRASKKSTAISSEVSSAAEDRSDKSHYVVINDVVPFHPKTSRIASPVTVDSKPSSRIEMYQADWVEVPEAAPVPVARVASPSKSSQQWKEEKNKRMLAWVKNSQVAGVVDDQPFWKVNKFFLSQSFVQRSQELED